MALKKHEDLFAFLCGTGFQGPFLYVYVGMMPLVGVVAFVFCVTSKYVPYVL